MTNFYVDDSVAISGNGTAWGSAWQNFSDINWSEIKPGDTLYISGGNTSQTYNQTLTVGASGTAGDPITITAGTDPGHNGTVIIDGQETRANGVAMDGISNVTVENLSVQNITDAGISVKDASGGVVIEHDSVYSGDPGGGNARGYDIRNSSGVDVNDNSYTTPANTLAQTDAAWSSGNNGVTFENNHFVISNSNTTGHSDGIQSFEDYNITIRNNVIAQANDATINNHGIWISDIETGGVINVYNNLVLAPHLTGDTAAGLYNDPAWTGTGTVNFDNNTIIGGDRALLFDNTPPTVTAENNILEPAVGGRFGVAIWNEPTPIPAANIDYNLIWAPNATIANVSDVNENWAGWKALGYDAHGVNADPLFADPATGNYALTASSPAIDHGATLAMVTTDINGVARPQGAAYDIGAYEYGSAPPPSSSPPPPPPPSTSTPLPEVSIGPASAIEGSNEIFPVTLSSASASTVTVNYATQNGTAVAGHDYTAASGEVTFAPGQTEEPIIVHTLSHHQLRSDETFAVNLADPSNATLGDASGTGTIMTPTHGHHDWIFMHS